MNGNFSWRKIKEKEMHIINDFLCKNENKYVSACSKFIARVSSRDCAWVLDTKGCAPLGILFNSKASFFPVLCGRKEIPDIRFLKGHCRKKKIHSVQGLKEEVIVFENALEKLGGTVSEIFDYDLMTLDKMPRVSGNLSTASNLVLRVPKLTDLNELAPLQMVYEKEEVLSKSSTHSPAASRINLANIITKGKILAVELNGKIIGKINVNGVSFNRYQVGGVFVHPDFRGLGIGQYMAGVFIASLINEGKGVTLFVKKANIAARRLYIGLGFSIIDEYRITYYQ